MYIIIGTTLLITGIGLTIYNVYKIRKLNKPEYKSIIIGKDNKIIKEQKVLDERTIDYKKNTYILDKDYFYKLGEKKYQFHYIDSPMPLNLSDIKTSSLTPDTISSILKNEFAIKLNRAGQKSPDLFELIKNNWVLIVFGVVLLIYFSSGGLS